MKAEEILQAIEEMDNGERYKLLDAMFYKHFDNGVRENPYGKKDGLLSDVILYKIAHHRPQLQPMVDEVKASTGNNRKRLERQLANEYDAGIASRLTSEELLVICEVMGI